jgi:predicted secreted protein
MKNLLYILLVIVFASCEDENIVNYDKIYSLSTDDTLIIRLEEKPSTGYKWSQKISDESILQLYNQEFYAKEDSIEPPILGDGGIVEFTFIPITKGETIIEFTHQRGGNITNIKNYKIIVSNP